MTWENIDTVGELIAELKKYPSDLVIEGYDAESGYGLGVTLLHVTPDSEEIADGSYEVLLFCADTMPTHRLFVEKELKDTSKWYNCAHCDAGYPDQECTCKENEE